MRESAFRQPMEVIMKNLTPRHIQEAESDRRSIKDGWYATNKTGQVCSGRFSNREDCQAHIEQEAKSPNRRKLRIKAESPKKRR
jgi:hypothetical protein